MTVVTVMKINNNKIKFQDQILEILEVKKKNQVKVKNIQKDLDLGLITKKRKINQGK